MQYFSVNCIAEGFLWFYVDNGPVYYLYRCKKVAEDIKKDLDYYFKDFKKLDASDTQWKITLLYFIM